MKRTFTYLGELTDDGFVQHDRDDVRQALLDLEGAVFQLGGIVHDERRASSRSRRTTYVTTGVLIAYDCFTPARRA